MNELTLAKGQGLIIVAHPDDETIWMGGTIASYQRAVDWIIFVLCRKSDPDRMPKFMRVATHYNAQGIICDLEDEAILSIEESILPIQAIIRQQLPLKRFDYLFTHASYGEYRHARHQGVHLAVKQMLENRELTVSRTFSFAQQVLPPENFCASREDAAFYTRLNKQEHNHKKQVIEKMYGFSPDSFESKSCDARESFFEGLQ
ncbi:MAG: hypothetical protein A3E07_03925 [Candidatus Wildermuthbacteria bacterium RIFCSPHIGHO2_12_FULL_45_9]|uniref:GlcNAc-PI de-N-acetylase n=1 Tax=Candidatus Wildermuthbacteria bacterium RIFCSPHIGHO2_02_FULL_45_25 TaxID=1802450 RepID=A0A1G2R1W7_9BACT|nr:MAG: hypothetical protein A3C04_03395 [Candidatus Wildermuthbacteria bacterium RIFCSPHIGHO2_02_FULL_45_25]OHA70737.1 MAG: hypothetical protein A3E07_03925 [Candidatus Wildermuthbacteria bacterium RIFCSPHIGHO2_12_FULL_45_9]